MESAPFSSEGFLNPDIIVGEFGISPGMNIADFGCGAGHIGILVAQRVGKDGHVLALDIMEDKLDSFKAQAKAVGLENIETKRANLEIVGNTGANDESQDMVILINILFQSNKKQDILKEAKREVLEDLMDIENTQKVIEMIEAKKIKIEEITTTIPSPFAFNLILQGHLDVMRMEDRIEFLKRMHQMVLAKIGKNADFR